MRRSNLLFPLLMLAVGGCGIAPSEPLSPDHSATIRVQWDASVGDMSPLLQPTVTRDGHICTVSANGRVSYLNAETGERARLEINLPHERNDDYIAGAGCAEDYVAAVSGDGWLRVHHIVNGLAWQKDLKSRVFGKPLIAKGKLYILGLDGRLLAFTLRRGRELWRYVSPLENLVRTPLDSSLVTDGSTVYGGIDNGAIIALDQANGRVLWENTVSLPSGNNEIANILDVTTPILFGNLACATAFQSGVACFNSNSGERLWHYLLPSQRRAALSSDGSQLFATDADGIVYAFNSRNGELLWRQKTDNVLSAPVAVNGMVLVGDTGGSIYAYSADSGELVTLLGLSGSAIIDVQRMPGSNENILALSLDGNLYHLHVQN